MIQSKSEKDFLRKVLNIDRWDKSNEPLLNKLIFASEIFFNKYIYYHLTYAIYCKKEIFLTACRYGNMKIVRLMIEYLECKYPGLPLSMQDRKVVNWDNGLYEACLGGHLSIIQLMIKKGANDWNGGLYSACEGGHLPIIELMIEKGADDFDSGLCGACCGGNLTIVELMIEKIQRERCTSSQTKEFELVSNEWNDGLYYACLGGHIQIAQLMIKKGANDWNSGLRNACYKGHILVVQLMVNKVRSDFCILYSPTQANKIAKYLNIGLQIAQREKHYQIIDYLSRIIKKLKIIILSS